MTLPGLFIEYLVIGAISMIWLLPFASLYFPDLPTENPALLLYVPAAYVIGMVIDFAGYTLLKPIRELIRRKAVRKSGAKIDSSTAFFIRLQAHLPDLAKLVEMRSSRDRIARGATTSSLMATIAGGVRFWQSGQEDMAISIIFYGLVAVLIFGILWWRYQTSSYDVEILCLRALEAKLQADEVSIHPQQPSQDQPT